MKYSTLNFKQKIYYIIRYICYPFYWLPFKIGIWATDKLNKSYYK